jgi:hypothetical protein
MDTSSQIAAQEAAQRFTALTEELCRLLTKHARARFIEAPLLLLIWNRLMRWAIRFASIAERVRAGTLSQPTPARRQPAPPKPADAPAPAPQPRFRREGKLPRRFGWLVHLLPEAEALGAELVWLMQRPEIEGLLFDAPQLGRILRPMCRMLGIEPTAALRRRPSILAAIAAASQTATGAHPAEDYPWRESPASETEPEPEDCEPERKKAA